MDKGLSLAMQGRFAALASIAKERSVACNVELAGLHLSLKNSHTLRALSWLRQGRVRKRKRVGGQDVGNRPKKQNMKSRIFHNLAGLLALV